MKKPISRTEFLRDAGFEHDRLMLEYEATLPRHERLSDYLSTNPVEGVSVVDRSDGLGPRAINWPEDLPHPDVDAWVIAEEEKSREAEAEALIAAEEAAKAEAARLEERNKRTPEQILNDLPEGDVKTLLSFLMEAK